MRVIRIEVRVVGEGIRTSKEAAWNMDDFEIEICKVE